MCPRPTDINLDIASTFVSLCVVLAYVHHLTPEIFQIGKFALRWYGLAYVLGFLLGFLLLRHFVRKGYSELKEDAVGDFITYCALFGVILGGRLGYMLFYDRPDFFANPLKFFQFWKGGMASHGGILGLVAFTWFYARRHKISWTGVGDNLVVVAPIGICLGRLANYINGELYGRAAAGFGWAMQFPHALVEREEELASAGVTYENAQSLVEAHYSGEAAATERLAEILTPRHPSQLYQAALEGLALFLILYFIRVRWKDLPHGILTGVFFLGYALFRIIGEQFREPDVGAKIFFGTLTPGQFYSTFMIVMGIGFIAYGIVTKRKNAPLAT